MILRILILSFILSPSLAHAKSLGDYASAIYLKNYDGDTIWFDLPNFPPIIGKRISVNLNGVDTPELKGKCAAEKMLAGQAKMFVKNTLTTTKQIDLRNLQRGKYFRIVADVIMDGVYLKELLLKHGLAVKFDNGKKTYNWCGENE